MLKKIFLFILNALPFRSIFHSCFCNSQWFCQNMHTLLSPPPSPHRVHLLPEIAFLSLPLSPRDLVWLKRTNHTREKSRNPKERNNKKVSQFPEIQSVLIIKHSLKKSIEYFLHFFGESLSNFVIISLLANWLNERGLCREKVRLCFWKRK